MSAHVVSECWKLWKLGTALPNIRWPPTTIARKMLHATTIKMKIWPPACLTVSISRPQKGSTPPTTTANRHHKASKLRPANRTNTWYAANCSSNLALAPDKPPRSASCASATIWVKPALLKYTNRLRSMATCVARDAATSSADGDTSARMPRAPNASASLTATRPRATRYATPATPRSVSRMGYATLAARIFRSSFETRSENRWYSALTSPEAVVWNVTWHQV
mmetsp:Transcript_59434/g.181363  ORF Transcript_59434/g.181363 Transcript_59434/m.181363 type:complete len:223 (+) Transcript_59434:2743-3411(+)